MAEPKKDQIAEAVVTAIRGATIGAGYYTDVGTNVSRRRLTLNELNQTLLPAASVWCGDGQKSPRQCAGGTTERVVVLVEVIYRSEERGNVDRDGIRHETDVRRAVLATSNLGMSGTVHQVAWVEVESDHQELSNEKLGVRRVGFEVDYNWTADAP